MQGSAKTAAIIVAGGGLAITMFWQFILTPRRRAALARTLRARLGRQRRASAPMRSAAPVFDDWRRTVPIVMLLAVLAVLMLLLAFVVFRLTLLVTIVTIAIIVITVVGAAISAARLSRFTEPAMSLAISTTCIAITLGTIGAADGFNSADALAGEWQPGTWVKVQDDPRSIDPVNLQRWELAIIGDCPRKRCRYQARALDIEGQNFGPVVLTPDSNGVYHGGEQYRSPCVAAADPTRVVVADGYETTLVYRLDPGPDDGPPGLRRPATILITMTIAGRPTDAAKAQNCPQTNEVVSTTAERN
jgi:hypothetical protein